MNNLMSSEKGLLLIVRGLSFFLFFVTACNMSNKSSFHLRPEDSSGIRIASLRLSAEGFIIDLRYTVTDPQKAKNFLKPGVRPYLIDQRTGARFLVPDSPKIGSLQQIPEFPEAGKTYFILFANPGRVLKSGDRVSIVLDKLRIDDLVIE